MNFKHDIPLYLRLLDYNIRKTPIPPEELIEIYNHIEMRRRPIIPKEYLDLYAIAILLSNPSSDEACEVLKKIVDYIYIYHKKYLEDALRKYQSKAAAGSTTYKFLEDSWEDFLDKTLDPAPSVSSP